MHGSVEKLVREMRQRKWRERGGNRRHGVHRRWRIRPEMLAGAADSGVKFRRVEMSAREVKGE
jgi:hypothetical protein